MSATEILEAAKALPQKERVKLAQDFWELVAKNGYEAELTADESAELDRRAEDALKNPGRGTPIEEISVENRKRFPVKK